VLEDGELIGFIASVVEDLFDEGRGNGYAAERAFDGLAALLASETRDEILRLIESLWEFWEFGAVAKVVSAHGDDDVDGQGTTCGGEKETDESGGFGGGGGISGGVVFVAEEFLKLIDEDE
jgi:hypothetical protein